jgi:hypothetical protein
LIVATFAGLALMIVLFLKMGMSDRAHRTRWLGEGKPFEADPNLGLDKLR